MSLKSLDKWQEAYMKTAETFGSLSSAKRLKVGAIVVKDNRIISIGYNGMPSGWTNECEDEIMPEQSYADIVLVTKKEVLHAESIAIGKLAKSHESGEGADIYVTHAPCIECAKQIYTAGIKSVFYRHKYRNDEGLEFLLKCGVEVINEQ